MRTACRRASAREVRLLTVPSGMRSTAATSATRGRREPQREHRAVGGRQPREGRGEVELVAGVGRATSAGPGRHRRRPRGPACPLAQAGVHQRPGVRRCRARRARCGPVHVELGERLLGIVLGGPPAAEDRVRRAHEPALPGPEELTDLVLPRRTAADQLTPVQEPRGPRPVPLRPGSARGQLRTDRTSARVCATIASGGPRSPGRSPRRRPARRAPGPARRLRVTGPDGVAEQRGAVGDLVGQVVAGLPDTATQPGVGPSVVVCTSRCPGRAR